MKLSVSGILIVIVTIFITSCRTPTMFTTELRHSLENRIELELQYYVDNAIILERETTDNRTESSLGIIVKSRKGYTEIIQIPAGSPGILVGVKEPDSLCISFEKGNDLMQQDPNHINYIVFHPTSIVDKSGAVSIWYCNQTGQISYMDKDDYNVKNPWGLAYLQVREKDLKSLSIERRAAPGRLITSERVPLLTTNPATNITQTSARLNGTVNPNGATTTAYFNYGLTTSYGNTTTSQAIGSGTTSLAVSDTVDSLTPGSLYNFRVVGISSFGTNYGKNLTFNTAGPPTGTTNPADNITSNSARLNGTVNPNGLNVTSCYFDYGLTQPTYGSTATVSPLPGSGLNPISVTANVSSLLASTLYNFRVVAINAGGTTNGLNQTFNTNAPPPPPTSTTNPADNITSNSAGLNGTVNPNGLGTNAYFQWGLDTSYRNTTTSQAIGNGTNNVAVTQDISSLAPDTQYNFRVVGINSGGTTNGSNLTFTTAQASPTSTTTATDNITSPPEASPEGEPRPNGGGLPQAQGSPKRLSSDNTTAPLTAVDDYIWVTNYNSKNITRIKKSDLSTTTIAVGTTPWGVAVDETYCWVANWGSNNVTRITKSDSTTTTIAVGSHPIGVAVDDTYCWVVNGSSSNVTRIQKSNLSTTTIAVGTGPEGIAVDETYVWVVNYQSANVTRIKKSDSSKSTIMVETGPRGVAVDETYCWVANGSSSNVTRILKSDSTTTTIAVGTRPYGVAVDGTYCWVTNEGSNNVTRIQKSDSTTTTIAVGTRPDGVAVDGTYCWVANQGSNNVTRILKSDSTTTTIAVGTNPYSLGDMTGYAYDNYSK